MKKLLARLTGGRPMVIGDELLYDHVANEQIYLCTDKLGRRWMAHSAWSVFRVPYLGPPPLPLDGLSPEERAKALVIFKGAAAKMSAGAARTALYEAISEAEIKM